MSRVEAIEARQQGSNLLGGASLRGAITVALECLEVGDQAGAVDVLLAALESDGPNVSSTPCPECGIDCEWPGRLEAHLLRVHHLDFDEVAAVVRKPRSRPRLRRAGRPRKAAA